MATQKTYVDYKSGGDTGADAISALQPVTDGEGAGQNTFRRPSENLRSRTEIIRDLFGDLLYYRDRTPPYLLELSGAGKLSWSGVAGSPAGRVNNTTELTIRPFLAPNSKLSGFLYVGDNGGYGGLNYAVNSGAYATEGVNRITVEHRSVTGTATITCVISDGPIYRIIVVFDKADSGHTAAAAQLIVTNAIAGHAVLAGKLACSLVGAGTEVLREIGETYIDARYHDADDVDSRPTLDAEAHTLPANQLDTFTTANALVEGDVVAIRYDYVIEAAGGTAGGRAESAVGRSNADVTSNLFLVRLNPEFVPGSLPLCKVVNGVLRWVDGTSLAAGTTGAPGASLGAYVDAMQFSGLPTMVVNGGIDNNPAAVLDPQSALESADARLSQSRYRTSVVTDGVITTGGRFEGADGVALALADADTAAGGTIFVRNGTYTSIHATSAGKSFVVEGESRDGVVLTPDTKTITNGVHTFRNLTIEAGDSFWDFHGALTLENVEWKGTLVAYASRTVRDSTKTTALPSSSGATYAENCTFKASGTGAAVTLTQDATLINCRLEHASAGAPFTINPGTRVRFVNCVAYNTDTAVSTTLDYTSDSYTLKSTQVFTASDTWTRPDGIRAVKVTVVGGGGGGGGSWNTGSGSEGTSRGGGGGGGGAVKWITSPGATETVTVGAGGSGTLSGTAGDGGTTSFGSHVSATGGKGTSSAAPVSARTLAAGGAGGAGASGDVNLTGGQGGAGFVTAAADPLPTGHGGASALGNGGVCTALGSTASGSDGSGYGGGGAGAVTVGGVGLAGADGSPGIVIVEEYA